MIVPAQGGAGGYGQGGAAGYGQGGFGGGGGGMGGAGGGFGGRQGGAGGFAGNRNPSEEPARKPKPDDDPQGYWTTKTAVLSPGDRVEYKFEVKKGETLLATATSDAFDPALSMVDAKGKELAKNDDREEGDQSPFLIVRFPEAGTYSLKVLSYGSKSGGKFNVKFRTFIAADAPFGPANEGPVATERKDYSGRAFFRLVAKKGKVYDLRNVRATKPYMQGAQLAQILGPTGVAENDYESIPTPDGTPVFIAKADGDYYAEYEVNDRVDFATDYHEVAVVTANPTDTVSLDLDSSELKIVELPVTPNLIVRTTLSGRNLIQMPSAPQGPVTGNEGQNDETHGTDRQWTWYLPKRDQQDDVVRVFHGTGTARFAIRSVLDKPQKATLKNTESLPLWNPDVAINDHLAIGEVRLFLLKCKKSELMKVFAKSEQFIARLDIFRLNGQLANSLMNRQTLVATDDLYFPDPDTFIVRLVCDGYGGSGDFVLRRDIAVAAPYALGAVQTMKLDGSNFGLYAVDLEAGKRYEFIIDHPDWGVRVDLLDEDGQFLTSQGLNFGGVAVQYFVPTRSGRHRLWLRAGSGEWRFKLQLHQPPGL